MSTLSDMHRGYNRARLAEATAGTDPLQEFRAWLDEALASPEVRDANAMTLATVDATGRPSTRIVLIKEVDTRGLVWFTNYDSRKGQDLAHNPFAALQFHWVALERVVRIEGRVEKIAATESDAYFASRPLGSRIAAWASPQSRVVADRAALEAAAAHYQRKFGDQPPRPPHWGGYRLVPDYWEFWQGRANRMNDRLRYRRDEARWIRERLAP